MPERHTTYFLCISRIICLTLNTLFPLPKIFYGCKHIPSKNFILWQCRENAVTLSEVLLASVTVITNHVHA